ncbi:oskar [Haematobia irritans]|uniref:oskar n=1 Tax=Haematobia irritans TaxID=7368 RepID=UPI003F4F6E41
MANTDPTTKTSVDEETTTIKRNSNSVSNGRRNFTALQEHITTCIKRWRQKDPSPKLSKNLCEHQPNPKKQQQKEVHQSSGQQSGNKWFRKYKRKDFCVSSSTVSTNSFVPRCTFNSKANKVPFSFAFGEQRSISTIDDGKEGPRRYGRKVEIVSKLLSLTLIGRESEANTINAISKANSIENSLRQRRRSSADSAYHSISDSLEIFQNCVTSTLTLDKDVDMTVTDLTFLEVRDEYPDLDAEVRGILLARAQDGATISEIRDDYRKLTGLTFPIYEAVTDFLLTIPYVTCYCNEKGTRIFNIRPMERTKHIHDLVMEQKNTNDQQPKVNHRRYRENQRNPNYFPKKRFYYPPRPYERKPPIIHTESTALNACNDPNMLHDHSEGFIEDNWFYNDNCNYLLNRIHNQEIIPSSYPNHMLVATDLFAANKNLQQVQQVLGTVTTNDPNNVDYNQVLGTATNVPNNVDFNQFNGNNIITADVPTYENNINHLNNLFQMAHNQPNTNNTNKNLANPRRSSYLPFKDSMPRSSRSSSPNAKSCYTNDSMFADSDYEAHLLDFLLLGDDFFLFMARMELRCKFKKHERILQSGLCVSGQTINAAIKRINALTDSDRSIIVNIGSVNIMQRRQLIQIEHEFRELINTMLKKGIKPILTTLAPLGNYSHEVDVKCNLERFNEFIKREGERKKLVVIDIWKCLANEKGNVRFDCYQSAPRSVTGATEFYLFWNKIGRQRVLNFIESKLEY